MEERRKRLQKGLGVLWGVRSSRAGEGVWEGRTELVLHGGGPGMEDASRCSHSAFAMV